MDEVILPHFVLKCTHMYPILYIVIPIFNIIIQQFNSDICLKYTHL